MAITKPSWLKDAIAKPSGYYSKKGVLLKKANLSEEHCAEWNGIESTPTFSPKQSTIPLHIQDEINKSKEVEKKSTILGRLINKFKKG